MVPAVARPRGRALVVVALLALPLVAGCAATIRSLDRRTLLAGEVAAAARPGSTLRAHLRDGGALVFHAWSVDGAARTVRGSGRRLDPDRHPVAEGAIAIAIDSVAVFESDALRVPAAIAPVTVLTALSLSLSAFCAANPKACFGSCPTFYAWDGTRQALVAEGFSASVAPALEADDLDALDRVRLDGRRFVLTMTDEALETHVVRRADLRLAPRTEGERVVADAAGTTWATRGWTAPDSARGGEGDCRGPLAARDAVERWSLADSSDLAARETLELSFGRAPAGPRGLVIVSRQSLLSTYVFYQTLAWMGRSAGAWLASLEGAGAGAREAVQGPGRVLGAIEVQVRAGAGWTTVGEFHETGPLAWDTRLVPLPPAGDGPLEVRLRLARGMWRIDQAALVSVTGPRETVRVPPARVVRGGRPDRAALASLLGEGPPLVTQPGDTLAIEYDLPAFAHAPEAFLDSRGYYLEWMREAWRAEENPERLAQLFLDPHGALRRLAPEFKRAEPEMDRTFWGSRYAH